VLRPSLVLSLVAFAAACAAPPRPTTAVTIPPKRAADPPSHPPAPTPAPPPGAPAPAPADAETVRACDPRSPQGQAAKAKLDALDARVQKLAPAADARPIQKEIEKLLADEPCFGLAVATTPFPMEFDSGLSLRDFWDQGGHYWLSSQLELVGKETPFLVIPPTSRHSLTSDVQTVHPLAPLLCPADAAMPRSTSTCGAETLGWMHRAHVELARASAAAHLSLARSATPSEPPPSRDRCGKKALASPPDEQFLAFANCVSQVPERADTLPLGRFAAPKDGWLVVRGRRGHYSGCEQVRAYDLATGAAYVSKSCFGMTTAPNQHSAEIGRVPVDAIREAALMIFLSVLADRDVVRSGEGHAIPQGIEPVIPAGVGAGIGLSGFGWSSGRTVMEVAWVRGGRGQARATLEWPDSDVPARQHATDLLAVAEKGFAAGTCAPAALPPMPWGALGPRIEKGYMPTFDDQPVYGQLRADFEALRARPACATGK
jgi:hypothetical protein